MRPTALLLALLTLLCGPVQPLTAQATARIIAIGDIHGSIDGIKSILRVTGLIDGTNKWSGGRTQLLQTGDYMDRGEHTRAVLDLLMALEPQAKDAGGRAFALLGNHEVMNLIGDTRDVTREIFATFADANSEKRRQEAWEDYAKLAEAKKNKGEPVPSVFKQTREAWLTTHPPGFVEYKEALSPKGKYGQWLRGKPMVTMVDGNIFMHAGISPASAPAKIEDLNVQVKDEIRRLDQFLDRLINFKLATRDFTLQEILQVASGEIGLANARVATAKEEGKELDRGNLNIPLLMEAQEIMKINTWLSIDPEGALWYRGLATEREDPAGGPFAALLAKYGAKRFVTGHTPQQSRSITVRYGGRAILIDTGMLTSYYRGRASALEITGDKLTAFYEDGKVQLQ
ncbi:MAG TPA: metallophosphoesterase [Vicinamibacterales bacterium]|nr:metallophosphoesterase [Vicinamibacterales bacterium]